jgi:hypothetical protein
MSSTVESCYPPVARWEDLHRLAALRDQANGLDVWDSVHDEIQAQFALLEGDIRGKVSASRATCGRTSGEEFFLFSYRTFSMPDTSIEPVVAAITFTPAGEDVQVEADISGEQTGDLIFSPQPKVVAESENAVLSAARELAVELRQAKDLIVRALHDHSRRVE